MRAADSDGCGCAMAKLKMPADAAKALTVPERLLLLCVAGGIDFKHAKVAEQVATEMVVKGLITLDTGGVLIGLAWGQKLDYQQNRISAPGWWRDLAALGQNYTWAAIPRRVFSFEGSPRSRIGARF